MGSNKRLILCTLLGVVFGVVCWGMISTRNPLLSTSDAFAVILARGTMGLALGISRLRWRWWLHGSVLGGVFSLPLAVSFVDAPEMGIGTAFGTLVMGLVYGLLIELVATFVFKVGPEAGG
jgi:hypothetical protein